MMARRKRQEERWANRSGAVTVSRVDPSEIESWLDKRVRKV